MHAFSGVFYSVDPESLDRSQAVSLPGFDLNHRYAIHSVLGTCNGVICAEVHDYHVKLIEYFVRSRRLLFGNPSTGVYKVLPDLLRGNEFVAGFGYVSSTDEYKFVRVDYVDRITRVYSLKSNTWSTSTIYDVHFIRPNIRGDNIGISFGDSIFWLVSDEKVLVEFDLKDEEFKKAVPLPCSGTLSAKVIAGGSLYVTSLIDDQVEIWSMKNKLPNLQMSFRIPKYIGYSPCEVHPLYAMKDDDEKILCCFRHLNENP